jgi:hypothetical protein
VYYSAAVALITRTGGSGVKHALTGILVGSGAVFVLSPPFVWPSVTNRLRPDDDRRRSGDAIVVQFPTGHTLLVDSGGTPGAFDVGERRGDAGALGSRRPSARLVGVYAR